MPRLLSLFQAAETTPDWRPSVVKGLPVFMSMGDFQQGVHESKASATPRLSGSCDIGQADVVMCGYQAFWVVFTCWTFSPLDGMLSFKGCIMSLAMGQVLWMLTNDLQQWMSKEVMSKSARPYCNERACILTARVTETSLWTHSWDWMSVYAETNWNIQHFQILSVYWVITSYYHILYPGGKGSLADFHRFTQKTRETTILPMFSPVLILRHLDVESQVAECWNSGHVLCVISDVTVA